ncbi:rna binding protein [Fusarium flagelliforme]|uniref:Rna binding protein n=1 Tax=Fusarium flagelliforme TaxID=2675880 RepID=A0A395MT74_9HYPO|nr:rna binding protein [Fusarium flagelliforme]
MHALPAHQRPFDLPTPSERVMCSNGNEAYRWVLTESERVHMAEMLGVDKSSIGLRGNVMNRDRMVCQGCGKHSGLDDMVHNALYAGIHSASFLKEIVVDGKPPGNGSPAHEIFCSNCTTKHHDVGYWEGVEPWSE